MLALACVCLDGAHASRRVHPVRHDGPHAEHGLDGLDRQLWADQHPAIFEDIYGDSRVHRILKGSFNCTWTATQGIGDIINTLQGSRPGDPLADVVFGIAMQKKIKKHSRKAEGA